MKTLQTGFGAMLVVFGLCMSPPVASAQDCGCDHRIENDQLTVNGIDLGVQPGDTVCVMAGEREFLRLESFQGAEGNPVTIKNCGGVVRIHNDTRAYALLTEKDSHHFRITGTGEEGIEYGFVISVPAREPYPGVGLWLLDRTTDYEVDHMEIFDTGFAGVSAKTDPLCDGSADQGTFVQRNSHIHHLYVHDTGGEGFYIGSTQANGQTITCDGSQEVRQPHFLEGLEVHDNIIENTGWDGAQIGMAHAGCRFYRNVIRNVGSEGVEYQQQGLQIGAFSQCEIFGNLIENGPTNGIFVLGAYDTHVHNNVVRNFGNHGIYANQQDFGGGHTYQFHFNTVSGYGENAITIYGPDLVGNSAYNNLSLGSEPGVSAGGDVDWTASNNLVFADAAAAGLVSDVDYQLTMASPAAGAGVAVSGVTTDFNGFDRPDPPSVGAFELGSMPGADVSPPDFSVGTDTGSGPDGNGGDGSSADVPDAEMGDGDSGCGCATHRPAPHQSPLVWLLPAGLLMLMRRRTRRRPV